MTNRDFYEVLGVHSTDTKETIKKAYHKLAMKYHPDRNPGDKEAETKFKEASAAWEILGDNEKRATYDRYGSQAFSGGRSTHDPFGFHTGGAGSFTDIFEEMFRGFSEGGQTTGAAHHGADLKYDLSLTLEEAFFGHTTEITLTKQCTCEGCLGKGSQKAQATQPCPSCGGRGKQRLQQGFFMIEQTCISCQGMGIFIKDPCSQCNGQGRVQKKEKLSLSIPAGIFDGGRLRVPGKGEAGLRGGSPGDLYVFVSIQPHPFFEREGEDLVCEIPIPMVHAALGDKIDIPLLEGSKATLTIPGGTQSGQLFRLKEKGMPILRKNKRGDLHVRVIVETPQKLTKEQKELLKEFSQKSKSSKTNPQSEGFLKKMRGLFASS